MAHGLLRGKLAGVDNDLSAGLGPDLFNIADICRYGINSQISKIAYDPVQSLLAIGTNVSQFGPGQIYVFGQKRVSVVLSLPKKASVKMLQFCAEKLLCLDSKNDLAVYSLESKTLMAAHSPPGIVTAMHTDPCLDYAFLGLQNGDVVAYDLDREALAPFKLPYFWGEYDPKARLAPVVALSLHPRDLGKLLIGYSEGAVIYSFKQDKPLKYFAYRLPPGAPGGASDPASVKLQRSPKLTQAVWHPTGTFILTGHEDSSLVVWDARDGRIVMARTLQDTNVDKPGAGGTTAGANPEMFAPKDPLFRIAWCANQDAEDTGILIAGGASTALPSKGLTFFELGRTPNYATSSWQVLANHFESPKRQRIMPTPPNAEVIDFCLIPRSSPHFGGAHDPIAVIALLSSSEIITLSFPSGHPITPTNQLHPSASFIHPYVNRASLSPIERTRWLGMTEKRTQGPPILQGGSEASRPRRRYESRNIIQTAHADGTVRLWDAGHGDAIENEAQIQADVFRALGRYDDLEVTQMSLAAATGELAVGLRTGEVALFRWSINRSPENGGNASGPNNPGGLTNVTDRKDPTLLEGLMPFTLLDMQNGPVTCLKLSDVGFVAAGFEGGGLTVVDLRGPAIIYNGNVRDFIQRDKRSSFRKSSSQNATKPDWPTVLEFSVMTLEGEDYSSILLHVGTVVGHLATFVLLPEAGGRYAVKFAGSVSIGDKMIHISPLSADSGQPAYASQTAVAQLRSGYKVNGVIVAVTQSGARVFKPATSKGANKTWDEFLCDSAAVARYQDLGYALVGLFGDGCARAFSLPGLKEVGFAKVNHILDVRRFSEAVVTGSGDILGWTGPSEMALLNVWGSGQKLDKNQDTLLNPEVPLPPRPTISNIQWISGTQHVTIADMDLLIGGPDRPPSKRMIMQARADEQQARAEARAGGQASASTQQQDETYWAYMQRQLNERTEKLNIVGDSMEKLETNSSKWADDVSKFVQRQKRNVVMGAVKSKFGF